MADKSLAGNHFLDWRFGISCLVSVTLLDKSQAIESPLQDTKFVEVKWNVQCEKCIPCCLRIKRPESERIDRVKRYRQALPFKICNSTNIKPKQHHNPPPAPKYIPGPGSFPPFTLTLLSSGLKLQFIRNEWLHPRMRITSLTVPDRSGRIDKPAAYI